MKTCSKCTVEKPLGEYYLRDGRPLAACKTCTQEQQQEWRRRNKGTIKKRNTRNREREAVAARCRKYDITPEQYHAMMDEQGAVCAACREDLLPWPCVDHCHATKLVRGILCNDCNLALGHLKDDPQRIMDLLRYLLG